MSMCWDRLWIREALDFSVQTPTRKLVPVCPRFLLGGTSDEVLTD
jgi:hypothetical protein